MQAGQADLTAQREILLSLNVPEDRIYLDHGLTGTNRDRPGLARALAAVRAGDTLVVPKLDRLARSVPDVRDIGDSLTAGGVKLSLGGTLYDPADPMGGGAGQGQAQGEAAQAHRPPAEPPGQQHQFGEHTIADLAELFSVSRATVYRVLERHQNAPAPSTPGGQ